MMVNELAVEQEEDSFSTQPILDSKQNRHMSIQEHINLDKMNKLETTRPMSIQDHINKSTHSIKSTHSVPGPKSSILDHIRSHEMNKFNTCEKPDEKVCILND